MRCETRKEVDQFWEKLSAGGEKQLLTRVFDVPRELVFKAWTDLEQVAQWYGPAGFSVVFLEVDRGAQTLMTFRQAGLS